MKEGVEKETKRRNLLGLWISTEKDPSTEGRILEENTPTSRFCLKMTLPSIHKPLHCSFNTLKVFGKKKKMGKMDADYHTKGNIFQALWARKYKIQIVIWDYQ